MTTDLHQIDDLISKASAGRVQLNRVAEALVMEPVDLANALGLDAITVEHVPQNEGVQRRLLQLCFVFRAAAELHGESAEAAYHLRNTSIRLLEGRTLLQAVVDGDHEMALRYLQSISGGQNG